MVWVSKISSMNDTHVWNWILWHRRKFTKLFLQRKFYSTLFNALIQINIMCTTYIAHSSLVFLIIRSRLNVVCVVDGSRWFNLPFLWSLLNVASIYNNVFWPQVVLESIFPLSANIKSCIHTLTMCIWKHGAEYNRVAGHECACFLIFYSFIPNWYWKWIYVFEWFVYMYLWQSCY